MSEIYSVILLSHIVVPREMITVNPLFKHPDKAFHVFSTVVASELLCSDNHKRLDLVNSEACVHKYTQT